MLTGSVPGEPLVPMMLLTLWVLKAAGLREEVVAIAEGTSLPQGAQFAVPRGNGTLLYTVVGEDATRVITGYPWIVQATPGHRRAGINLASYALDALRRPPVIATARAAPFPRLAALLGAIGDVPSQTDQAGNWYFSFSDPAGGHRLLSLDQVPLPAGTPPPLS